MKAKLVAGAEFDLLTKQEVTDVVGQAIAAQRYGIQIKPIVRTQTDPNNAGQITLEVPDGWMWDVRSIYVSKSAADVVRIYRNDTQGIRNNSIADDGDNGNFQLYNRGGFAVRGGQKIIVLAKTGGTILTGVRLSVMEVPDGYDWHLK